MDGNQIFQLICIVIRCHRIRFSKFYLIWLSSCWDRKIVCYFVLVFLCVVFSITLADMNSKFKIDRVSLSFVWINLRVVCASCTRASSLLLTITIHFFVCWNDGLLWTSSVFCRAALGLCELLSPPHPYPVTLFLLGSLVNDLVLALAGSVNLLSV